MSAELPQRNWDGDRQDGGAPRRRPVRGILRGLRPKQWIKNLLVFAGFVFTMNERWQVFSPTMWEYLGRSAIAFLLFSLLASSVYLLNDVIDVDKDRAHPTKRNRPVASGQLAPGLAVGFALLLMPGTLIAGYWLSPPFALVIAGYLIMQMAYVFLLKKVVLVDVFTVDCINCRNVTPNLRHLSKTLQGKLVIVGVHTPETPAERERGHVVASLRELGITWPVAIDDDSAVWNAYGVEAWPTEMLFDRKGRLRKTIVGDSQDDALDAAVSALLTEK